ncbi:MAG: HWE histidine kinase domain-containing protein [Dongiaceae bacterium]
MSYDAGADAHRPAHRSADAAILLEMASDLAAAESVGDVMSAVVWPMRALLGAGGVTFVLRDGDQCYYAEESAIAPLWKGQRFPLDSCISGWCMKERSAAVIGDIYRDPRIPQDLYRSTFVRSLAMVPVRREAPIAAFGVYWPQLRTPAPEELRLMQAVGDLAGLAIDAIAAAARSAEQAVRGQELEHRLKNVFAIVLGLTRLTEAGSVAEYRAALASRIQALAAVNGELLAVDGPSAELEPLLGLLLRPALGRVLFRPEPPTARTAIARAAVVPFGLALHELLANALIHGSLSVAGGTVACAWRAVDRSIRFRWTERDGPVVRPPARQGLGTRLIALLLQSAGGTAAMTYARSGLVCDIGLPAHG